jgi:hypothetical protein
MHVSLQVCMHASYFRFLLDCLSHKKGIGEGNLSASVCEYKGIFVQVARIVIHDGDNGADLASSFCKQYKLDDGTCKKSLHRKFKLNPVFLKMDPRISLCLTH